VRKRIYRGAVRPIEAGSCPSCTRIVGMTSSGRRRMHRDLDGQDCTGSGVKVGEESTVDRLDPHQLADAIASALTTVDSWADRDRTKPANPWSGKA